MSITTVLPPISTPGGWFGCFGPPSKVTPPNVPVAWPVSGQEPCGNGTVESCCIIGDQCLSNGVCQIIPVANDGQDPLYYGAYCTDPTFSSDECTANCAVRYMAYCGSNDIWQCGDTDRANPFACNLTDTTTGDSSTFFMIEPTKLAKGELLPSTEPSTTQAQYIPTQWGTPQRQALSTSLTTLTSIAISASFTTPTNSASLSAGPTQAASSKSHSISTAALSAIISIATISGTIIAAVTLFATIFPKEVKRGCTWFWKWTSSRPSGKETPTQPTSTSNAVVTDKTSDQEGLPPRQVLSSKKESN